ncbi:MAG: DUF1045 domain-containing protein [Pararhodobacter sp.]
MTRYALYFAPAEGAFAEAAAGWLGRDAASGAVLDPLHPDLPALTASARRYGFHATLKAPFRLAEGQSEAGLIAAMDRFGAETPAVTLDGLRIASLGGFLALVPEGDEAPLNAFAAQVVRSFDPFRAPLTPAEVERRKPATLSPRQRAMLGAWGYPYVLDEFRFHMTLSDRLDPAQRAWVEPLAQTHLAPHLPRPAVIDALSLFTEEADGAFRIRHRSPLS